MKIYWTALFTLFTLIGFAQTPTGDIEKDTAQANRYFEEGIKLQAENYQNKEISDLYKKAATLYEAHPFDKKLIEIKAYTAMQLSNEGNYQLAKATAEEAISLMEKEVPHLKNSPIISNAYQALFVAYFTNNADKCIEYGLKGLACEKEGSEGYFGAAHSLFYAYATYSRFESLKILLEELELVLNKQKDDKLDKYWLIVYFGKTLLYKELRNYEQAILYSRKLFADNEKYKTFPIFELAPIYMDMGVFLTRIHEYEEAITWAEKGLKSTSSKNPGRLGTFYNKFAYILWLQKKYEKAIENYDKAIELFEKDSVTYKNWIASAYKNIAEIYNELKEYDKAIENVEKSKQHSFMVMQGYSLARSWAGQGKYEMSLKELQQVLISYSTKFKNNDIDENPSIYEEFKNPNFANILLLKGRYEYEWGRENKDKDRLLKSYETLKIAFSHYETIARTNKGFDKSRFILNKDLISTLDYMIRNQAKLYDLEPTITIFNELLYLAERRKAFQLIETLSPSSLPATVIKKEQGLLKMLSDNGQKLDLAKFSNQKDSIRLYQDALFETSQLLEEHFESVKKDYPKQSNDFYNNEYATLQEIQSGLDANTLLIEYNNLEANNDFIISIGSSSQKKTKIKLSTLSTNIQNLNKLIQSRLSSQKSIREKFIKTSHELYNALIKPIEAELEGKSKLMIVVEGQLFHLPFELLLASDEKKPYHELDFLIKKYEINYHYSATAFLKLKEKETIKDNSLLAFAPIFNKGDELTEANRSLDFLVDSVYRSIEDFEFTALPSTKKEVNTISKLVKSNNGQANVLLSKNATKDKLAQQIEQQPYQFVHIATHGLVNFKNPRLSALACYSKDETMDNLMYANEIQFKNINADLVILSSCESGIGQLVQGEGLIALNRSFIYSGAKNVIFSLWKVSDKYSSELMIDFYQNYFDNTESASYTSALRQAKLKMLEDPISAQPKFWSAFVLMGE